MFYIYNCQLLFAGRAGGLIWEMGDVVSMWVNLHKEKFLESVILFLKYIKYIYLYTNIPILFGSTISVHISHIYT